MAKGKNRIYAAGELYVHKFCETSVPLSTVAAEILTRDKDQLDSLYCPSCQGRFTVDNFTWTNGRAIAS
ncbi:hypothetical protein LCGC14_1672730 [marine sediment metagenome]|uniref:Uncharacterized protein n=1 Tax=marine sediment metagenome TaxID=412755 RepID=A0A0F9ID86_9ZZZZ